MTYLWGAVGAASVQAAADILSLALALPLIRSVKAQISRAALAAGEGQPGLSGEV